MTFDYVRIRKGTDIETAMKKGCVLVCNYLKSNSKQFKIQSNITINLQGEEL